MDIDIQFNCTHIHKIKKNQIHQMDFQSNDETFKRTDFLFFFPSIDFSHFDFFFFQFIPSANCYCILFGSEREEERNKNKKNCYASVYFETMNSENTLTD